MSKVIKSLENGGILLKRNTKWVKNQKGGYLGNILTPLIKFGLPWIKNVLTPIANAILKLLELMIVASEIDRATHHLWIRSDW